MGGLVGRHVDLDAVAAHADLDVEAATGAVAALGDDPAGDAAGPVAGELDVVRPEDERARAVGAGGAGTRCGRSSRNSRPSSRRTGSALNSPMKPETNGDAGRS